MAGFAEGFGNAFARWNADMPWGSREAERQEAARTLQDLERKAQLLSARRGIDAARVTPAQQARQQLDLWRELQDIKAQQDRQAQDALTATRGVVTQQDTQQALQLGQSLQQRVESLAKLAQRHELQMGEQQQGVHQQYLQALQAENAANRAYQEQQSNQSRTISPKDALLAAVMVAGMLA